MSHCEYFQLYYKHNLLHHLRSTVTRMAWTKSKKVKDMRACKYYDLEVVVTFHNGGQSHQAVAEAFLLSKLNAEHHNLNLRY